VIFESTRIGFGYILHMGGYAARHVALKREAFMLLDLEAGESFECIILRRSKVEKRFRL
jgi:hypothetical protein